MVVVVIAGRRYRGNGGRRRGNWPTRENANRSKEAFGDDHCYYDCCSQTRSDGEVTSGWQGRESGEEQRIRVVAQLVFVLLLLPLELLLRQRTGASQRQR